jgi:hypothetical protein
MMPLALMQYFDSFGCRITHIFRGEIRLINQSVGDKRRR